jgi:RNA polymerase sigma factor (sigma-70 family)
MTEVRIYAEDLQTARALISRDEGVTRRYFYQQCYPMFKSVFDHYYTDCNSCKEFIDEIYVLVMTPSRITGHCQLESFRGESTLTSWLKTVSVRFCYERYERKERMTFTDLHLPNDEDDHPDRNDAVFGITDPDFGSLNLNDVMTILAMMPNKRYSTLIRLRYLEEMTNEETAEILGMSLDNYYNKHKLAKAQFEQVLRKEIHYE